MEGLVITYMKSNQKKPIVLLLITMLIIINVFISSFFLKPSSWFYVFLLLTILGSIIVYLLSKEFLVHFLLINTINTMILLFIFINYLSFYDLPYYYGGSDDKVYEEAASIFSVSGFPNYEEIKSNPKYFDHNSKGYIYFVSILIYLSNIFFDNYSTITPRVVNIFFLSMTSFLVFIIAKKSYAISRKYSITAAYIFSFTPLVVFNSSHIFRDTIVMFLGTLYFYIISKLKKKWVTLSVPFLIIILGIIYHLREEWVYILLIATIVSFIIKQFVEKKYIKGVLIIIPFALLFIYKINLITDILFGNYHTYNNYRADINSGISNLIFTSPSFISLPLKLMYLYLTPFPYFTKNFFNIYLSIGTILLFMMIIVIIYGLKIAFNRKYIYLITFTTLLYIIVALTTFTDRHLMQIFPFLSIFFVIGLQKSVNGKIIGKLILYNYLLLCILIVLYMLLKVI